MEKFLNQAIATPHLHARWLNTLSYMENCGARMLARAEHPTLVKEEMLKHAAEEFRHALHFKKQIYRIKEKPPQTYALPGLIGGYHTLHYLAKLEVAICRVLGRRDAYLFVTYAIEWRAKTLYPLYHNLLKEARSPVSIKSVLLEEEEHLEEITKQIDALAGAEKNISLARSLEETLFFKWRREIYSSA